MISFWFDYGLNCDLVLSNNVYVFQWRYTGISDWPRRDWSFGNKSSNDMQGKSLIYYYRCGLLIQPLY